MKSNNKQIICKSLWILFMQRRENKNVVFLREERKSDRSCFLPHATSSMSIYPYKTVSIILFQTSTLVSLWIELMPTTTYFKNDRAKYDIPIDLNHITKLIPDHLKKYT